MELPELVTQDLAFLAVYADGNICLDILQNTWSPVYDVLALLTSIQVCLCDFLHPVLS